MGRVTWPRSRSMANSLNTRAHLRAHWVPASRPWPIDSQLAHECIFEHAHAHDLALGRGQLEPVGVDLRRVSLAVVRRRRSAPAGAFEWTGARQTLHVRLGNAV